MPGLTTVGLASDRPPRELRQHVFTKTHKRSGNRIVYLNGKPNKEPKAVHVLCQFNNITAADLSANPSDDLRKNFEISAEDAEPRSGSDGYDLNSCQASTMLYQTAICC